MTFLDDAKLEALRSLAAEPAPGDVLDGRFELRERIGEGAMGSVYAARDRETGTEVAVKILDVEDDARWKREALLLRSVEHPAIARYLAHGTSDGMRYVAMERLEGCTLAERLESGALAPAETIALGARLADAMSLMHDAGITHRDVKPSNVFLVRKDAASAVLLDFSLARRSEGTIITAKGALVGTPGYVAPEQVRADGIVGPPADVFALGCLLYECIANARAFDASKTEALLARALIASPAELPKSTPPKLAALIGEMLAKDPELRPPARAVASTLAEMTGDVRGTLEETTLAGKYRIEEKLGEGGMGLVFAGRHLELGTRVAIKVLRTTDGKDEARFLREARAASKLESEHVARVLDFGRSESGAPFIVMEHLAGEDLARRLAAQGPLHHRKAVAYVLEACEGLAEAHALGIIHRDVKPSNLFVVSRRDGSETVKVLDFGISKVTAPSLDGDGSAANTQTLTGEQGVVGSIPYMSPEQLQAASSVDARSDVWSIGVVLYELVSGKRPFSGDSPATIAARIAAAPAEPLAGAPPLLDRAIRRCLEKDPNDRFANLAALSSALAPFADGSSARVARIRHLVGGSVVEEDSRRRSRAWLVPLGIAAGVVVFVVGRSRLAQEESPVSTSGSISGAASIAVTPSPSSTASVAPPGATVDPPTAPTKAPSFTPSSLRPAVSISARPQASVPRGGPSSTASAPRPRSTEVDLRDPALEER